MYVANINYDDTYFIPSIACLEHCGYDIILTLVNIRSRVLYSSFATSFNAIWEYRSRWKSRKYTSGCGLYFGSIIGGVVGFLGHAFGRAQKISATHMVVCLWFSPACVRIDRNRHGQTQCRCHLKPWSFAWTLLQIYRCARIFGVHSAEQAVGWKGHVQKARQITYVVVLRGLRGLKRATVLMGIKWVVLHNASRLLLQPQIFLEYADHLPTVSSWTHQPACA